MEEETSSKKYEVFLSFRGVDTRNTITSHLYEALRGRYVETFKDDPDLREGDEISQALFKAIEESHISLVIFSKNYASSRWCLEELVKILQCKEHGQIVIPVFYEVEPTDVRNQTGSYAEAFDEFKASKKHLDKLQTWKDALKEAANHSGYSSLVTKPEALLVQKVVQKVSERLSMVRPDDSKGLIGIDSRMNEIVAFLVGEGVPSVGIWGAGGIGKTTLAKAVFDKISIQFEGSCFLYNVSERYGKAGAGLNELQTEFYGKITGGKCISNRDYFFEKRTLQHKRLLIVFDDVTGFEPIEKLISMEGFDFLDSRSRVIVTSRDRQVLDNCEVKKVYEAKVLYQKDAIKLFSRHALREYQPKWEYEELSGKFVNRLGGLPLALKVIGSHLCKKEKKFWENSLKKLEKVVDKKIESVLKLSYDELDDEQQQIFLDIVYFFTGEYEDQICRYLSYYESVDNEIEVLIDKSLIVKLDDNRIIIHDLLQDMGKMIERKQNVRARLSGQEDICNFLEKNGQDFNRIQGISLDLSQGEKIDLNLSTLRNIKILEFYCSNVPCKDKIKVSISEGCDFICNALRKFYWYGCPLKSFSSKFHPVHLVSLNMCGSKIEKLWDGGLHFPQLKEIDLTASRHLTTCPDLSGAPNLKQLVLSYCESLTCIPDCFASLTSLKWLMMDGGCSSLQRLPELSGMKSLEELDLSHCPLIEMLPELPSNIQKLHLHGCSKIHKLPVNIGNLESLERLDLGGCKLQDSINSLMDALSGSCSTLTYLNLSDCGIKAIPDSLGHLSKLTELALDKNDFESIATSIINLADLDFLNVSNCKMLKCLPELPSIREINAANCSLLKSVHKLSFPYPRKRNSHVWSFFYFEGCVNLCPDAFVEDFLGTLQSLATSWTADKLLSQYPSNAYPYESAGMRFLGSKIPECFSFQCMGSSITMKLPRKGEDKIFVGFAVCAVVDASAGYAPELIRQFLCEYTLNSKDGGGHTFRGHFGSHWSRPLCENFESEYLFIGCDPSMYPRTITGDLCELCYDTEFTFEFSLKLWLDNYNKPEVKSCGVHPMYAENFGNASGSLELREIEVGNSSGSLELRETKDEPHPKRQKIQYNS